MENEGDFRLGFWFGTLLAGTMGFKADLHAIYEQLRSVARGELTLMASPEEALIGAQAALGRPLTDEELELYQSSLPSNRAEQDARNRDLALLILRLMRQPE